MVWLLGGVLRSPVEAQQEAALLALGLAAPSKASRGGGQQAAAGEERGQEGAAAGEEMGAGVSSRRDGGRRGQQQEKRGGQQQERGGQEGAAAPALAPQDPAGSAAPTRASPPWTGNRPDLQVKYVVEEVRGLVAESQQERVTGGFLGRSRGSRTELRLLAGHVLRLLCDNSAVHELLGSPAAREALGETERGGRGASVFQPHLFSLSLNRPTSPPSFLLLLLLLTQHIPSRCCCCCSGLCAGHGRIPA